jgi:FeS assembly SUF system protein
MRNAGLARDESGAGKRRRGEDGMSEDVQTKPETQAADTQGSAPASALPPEELEAFGNVLIAALKTVYDPEIPVDIYELGLIYKVDVADNKDVTVDMTLTAPGCPVAGEMPGMVKDALLTVPGIGEVTVNMTFDPPWTPDRMSEEAKLELNMF